MPTVIVSCVLSGKTQKANTAGICLKFMSEVPESSGIHGLNRLAKGGITRLVQHIKDLLSFFETLYNSRLPQHSQMLGSNGLADTQFKIYLRYG
jgi:hypothetical protein